MEQNISVFISYKKDKSAPNAGALKKKLESELTVWQDSQLRGGDKWDEEIYLQIRKSDVLVLVIGPGVSDSTWVKREIDIAQAALVSILPVRHINKEDAEKELAALQLDKLQHVGFEAQDEAEIKLISDSIEKKKDETREKQGVWFKDLGEMRRTVRAENNQRAFTFKTFQPNCKLYIATGDLVATQDIDVLVNSENDFMQMSRHFESRTISSILRDRGSYKDEYNHFTEDTIQDEINQHLHNIIRPVGAANVIVTSTGYPTSTLRKRNKARFIFHVATVLARDDGLKPITNDDTIKECVLNSLEKILWVDANQGVVSPQNTKQRTEQEDRKAAFEPIKSIIFPMIGTGQGGQSINKVIKPMINGIEDFLDRQDFPSTLDSIYISVFSKQDIDVVKSELSRAFELVTS